MLNTYNLYNIALSLGVSISKVHFWVSGATSLSTDYYVYRPTGRIYTGYAGTMGATPTSSWNSFSLSGASAYTTAKRLAAEAGYDLVAGSFEDGGTVNTITEVLWYQGDGKYYGWAGAFPKVVTAGSTPATSGGIGAGAWVDRSDVTLRSDINVVVKTFNSVADMKADATLIIGQKCHTLGYYAAGDGGGNDYEIVAAATGANDGGSYIELSGSGFQAKGLFGNVVDVKQFGAKGDGASDDYNPLQKAFNYAISKSITAYISNGVFLTSQGLTFTASSGKTAKLTGAGVGLSKIKQSSSGFTVLSVDSGFSWPSEKIIVSDFCTEGISKISATDIGFRFSGTSLAVSNLRASGLYNGFYMHGVQFNSFNNLMAFDNIAGLWLNTTALTEGGNNNRFENFFALANVVGVMLTNGGGGELILNDFSNLVTHANMCGFYASGPTGYIKISNWGPERNGGSTTWPESQKTVNGVSVSRCALESNNARIFMDSCYPFTTSTEGQYGNSGVFYVKNNSTIELLGTSMQGVNFIRDTTSRVDVVGGCDVGGTISDSYFPAFTSSNEISSNTDTFSFATESLNLKSSSYNNHAASYGNPSTGYCNGGTSSAYTLARDAALGVVSKFTFSAGNQAIITTSDSITSIGETVMVAFNVMAESDGIFEFDLAQSTANIKVNLMAGVWNRVVLFGTTYVAPRGGFLRITPYDSTGLNNPLYLCDISTAKNPTKMQKHSILNGGINYGPYSKEYKASSPPTFGSWVIGESIKNSSPIAGGYSGFVCIASGTPGVWKGYGTISS